MKQEKDHYLLTEIKNVLQATFWIYPNVEYNYGLEAFKNSNFNIFSWIATCLLLFFLLTIWFQPFIKSPENIPLFSKKNYIFTAILGLFLSLYPLIPFFISATGLDSRHTYLPHLGLSVLIVLIVRGLLEIIQRLIHKRIKIVLLLIIIYYLSQLLTLGAQSMIGLGTTWRQVGLDLKNYEVIVKQEFPTIKHQTLFLIKDAEISRMGAPVFPGKWVLDGLFRKIYPHQEVRGDYYNIPTANNQHNLTFEINPKLNYIKISNVEIYMSNVEIYPFKQVIILDGKNELRPFSAINIRTPEGDYLKKLQTSDNNDTIGSVLEISIP